MIAFLNRALLLLFLGSATAFAAPAMPRDTAPPIDAMDADTVPESSDEEVPPPLPVSSAPVNKPSIEGFGTLGGKQGGLDALVWKGSTRDSAEDLLQLMHSGIADGTLSDLTVRLLMTQATPPAGATQGWFITRINTLIAMGQDEKAGQMIASLPVSMISDPLRQIQEQLLFLRGDADSACRLAATLPDNTGSAASVDIDTSFWQKVNIVCQARAGKQNEVMVGLDILREENKLGEPFFQEAVHKFSDKTATIKSLPKKWSLFDVALIRLTGDGDKLKDKMDAIPAAALKYLAADTSLDTNLRDKARNKAEQEGLLPSTQNNKLPEQAFAKTLSSDVTTLIAALVSDKPANNADNAVITRLALDENSSLLDSKRIQRLLTLMEPFGYSVPPAVWQKLFIHKSRYDGEVPPAVLVAHLNEAAQAGKKGEVILLSALILGANETDKVSELAILPVVKALKAVGFEKEARHIAADAVKPYSGR